MGYSSRYHAASLAAVFLALAVGILIGIGLGDSVVSGTERNLSESLGNDIEDARAEADDLATELERERQFAARAFPALVGDQLKGRRVGVLAFGDLSPELTADIEEAIEPAGAELAEVSVVRVPPDAEALAGALGIKMKPRGEVGPDLLGEIGVRLGRQFAMGREGLSRARETLFSRSSGEGGKLDGVVFTLGPGGADDLPEIASTKAFIDGLSSGLRDAGVPVVAVERQDAPSSGVPFFSGLGITTVDNVDSFAGRVATVFALLGADGDFGVKPTAQSLLPELLTSRRVSNRRAPD